MCSDDAGDSSFSVQARRSWVCSRPLAQRGLTVIAADRDPSAPGFRYADRRAIVSIEDEPASSGSRARSTSTA